jgi:hypothetical protein
MHTKFEEKKENGFCGFVLNTDVDDRCTIAMFCIWNSKGQMVYINSEWGIRNYYNLQL